MALITISVCVIVLMLDVCLHLMYMLCFIVMFRRAGGRDAAGSYRCIYRAANTIFGGTFGETCNAKLPAHALATLHTQQCMCTQTGY